MLYSLSYDLLANKYSAGARVGGPPKYNCEALCLIYTVYQKNGAKLTQ